MRRRATSARPARLIPAAVLAAMVIALAAPGAQAQSDRGLPGRALVADLSERAISITLGFTGTNLLLFGATDGVGDVVIVVRGPATDVTVRRKERIGGIWINNDSASFTNVPGFYLVASTGPLDEIVAPEVRIDRQIGLDALYLPTLEILPELERSRFSSALLRNKQRDGLYVEAAGSVTMQEDRLFRTDVTFPSNVPIGGYVVDVILLRDGQVVGMTTTQLGVDRRGFEALVFSFAHRQSAAYGLIAIVIALMAGWLAGFVFRKF